MQIIMGALQEHRAVQAIAKAVLADLAHTIVPADTERTIADRAAAMLLQHGVAETWYYACPALVLVGSRTCLSISGREYVPSEQKVGDLNLVTVDLSPMREGIWGDCARSFFIEDGTCVQSPSSAAFVRGIKTERALHEVPMGLQA